MEKNIIKFLSGIGFKVHLNPDSIYSTYGFNYETYKPEKLWLQCQLIPSLQTVQATINGYDMRMDLFQLMKINTVDELITLFRMSQVIENQFPELHLKIVQWRVA